MLLRPAVTTSHVHAQQLLCIFQHTEYLSWSSHTRRWGRKCYGWEVRDASQGASSRHHQQQQQGPQTPAAKKFSALKDLIHSSASIQQLCEVLQDRQHQLNAAAVSSAFSKAAKFYAQGRVEHLPLPAIHARSSSSRNSSLAGPASPANGQTAAAAAAVSKHEAVRSAAAATTTAPLCQLQQLLWSQRTWQASQLNPRQLSTIMWGASKTPAGAATEGG